MKYILLFIITITCFSAKAQHVDTIARPDTGRKVIRICVPSRSSLKNPATLVLKLNKRVYYTKGDSVGLALIDPKWIEAVDVLRDSASAAIYSGGGKTGVIVITLKNKPSDISKKVKQLLKEGRIKQLK